MTDRTPAEELADAIVEEHNATVHRVGYRTALRGALRETGLRVDRVDPDLADRLREYAETDRRVASIMQEIGGQAVDVGRQRRRADDMDAAAALADPDTDRSE